MDIDSDKVYEMIKAFMADLEYARNKMTENYSKELARTEQECEEELNDAENNYNEEHQRLETVNERKNARIAELRGLIDEKVKKIKATKENIINRSGDAKNLSDELDKINTANASLSIKLNNQIAENESLTDQIIENAKRKVDYEFYKKENKELEDEITKMKKRREQYEIDYGDMEKVLDKKRELFDKLGNDKSTAQQNSAYYKNLYEGENGLKKKREDLVKDYVKEQEEHNKTRQSLLTEIGKTEKKKTEKDLLKEQNTKLENQSKQNKADIEKMEKDVKDQYKKRISVKDLKYEYQDVVDECESTDSYSEKYVAIHPLFLPISYNSKDKEGVNKKIRHQRRLVMDDGKGNVVYGDWEDQKVEEIVTCLKT